MVVMKQYTERILIQEKAFHKRTQMDQGSQGWGREGFMEEVAFESDMKRWEEFDSSCWSGRGCYGGKLKTIIQTNKPAKGLKKLSVLKVIWLDMDCRELEK